MHLLVEARLAEFHSDVELLVRGEDDRASPAVAFPLALEAYLMEGSYNKVGKFQPVREHSCTTTRSRVQILAARNVMPSPEFFGPLVERLTLTVRDDIAECAAASFSALSLAAAQKLFMFDNATDFLTFARSKVRKSNTNYASMLSRRRCSSYLQSTWSLSDRGISFATVAKNAAVELPVAALVENTLSCEFLCCKTNLFLLTIHVLLNLHAQTLPILSASSSC